MSTLALDIGNTSVAAAVFETRQQIRWEGRFALDQEPVAVPEIVKQPFDQGVLGSVAGVAGQRWEQALRRSDPRPWTAFHRGDEFPVVCDVTEPSRVGVDRLAAALGAFTGERSVIVVDLGTAITVDWMSGDGVFRGGAIVPGRRLAARSLAEGTAGLPAVELSPPEPLHLPGRSTEEAIGHGLDVGLPRMVDGLVRDLMRAVQSRGGEPTGVDLWVTGGDADWYRRRTELSFQNDRHLVLRGLWDALRVDRRTP